MTHGPHPKDQHLFAASELSKIAEAAQDLRYLLGRGYALKGSLKLVGDRQALRVRQLQFLKRAVAAPVSAAQVHRRCVVAADLGARALLVDGHNVLITLETALAGGLLLGGDDGFLRDLTEAHGSYRPSEHTDGAIALLCQGLKQLQPREVSCFLDAPMPFSGELAARLRERLGPRVRVETAWSADFELKQSLLRDPEAVLASSDSVLLAQAAQVFDLAGYLVRLSVQEAWLVVLPPSRQAPETTGLSQGPKRSSPK